MNLIQWSIEGFSTRVIMNRCHININGITKIATIHQPDERGWINIDVMGRDDLIIETLHVNLEYMNPYPNGWMIMCSHSEPGGKLCVLIIPKHEEQDEEEE